MSLALDGLLAIALVVLALQVVTGPRCSAAS